MFEILVELCAADLSETCATRLVPANSATCTEALEGFDKWQSALPAGLRVGLPRCVPRPQSKITFVEVAPGLYVHRGLVEDAGPANQGDIANIGFILGTEAIAVIDSGGSRHVGEQVYLAIRAVSDLPITHLILTHMHPDHVFGAGPLAEAGAAVIGHDNLPEALAARRESYETGLAQLIGREFTGTRTPIPDATIGYEMEIDLGDRMIRLQSWPIAHTTTDITVFDTDTGILFAGDLLFDEHTPALDGSLPGWQSAMAALADLGARRIVPGHGGPLLDLPDGMAAQSRYLTVLATETRAAIADGLTLSEAVDRVGWQEEPEWALFDLFHPRNVTTAYTELEWE